jgi:hypothetical protein
VNLTHLELLAEASVVSTFGEGPGKALWGGNGVR